MIISKVSLHNLRPIHKDSTEITKKYKQIKSLLNDGSHSLFAEPEYITSTEIIWKSNLDGDVIQYTNADEDTQGIIRIQLKKQFNEIYNNSKIKDDEEIKQYIDLIFEVPKLDSIYMINDHVVIDNWGYIEDNYNAERDIIKKLIDGVLFNVNIEDENGIAVVNLPIKIKYGNDLKEYKTDDDGNVLIDVIYGNFLYIEIDLKGNDKYKDEVITESVACLRDKTDLNIKIKLFVPPIPVKSPEAKELSWFEKNKKLLLILLEILIFMILILIFFTNKEVKTDIPKPVKKQEIIIDNKVLEGKHGDPRVNLSWDNNNDLDIYVVDPCGNMIYHKKKTKTCNDNKGILDVDAQSSKSKLKSNPQENIVWENGGEKGTYKIKIKDYKNRTGTDTSYNLIIINNGKTTRYSGVIEVKEEKTIATFTH